MQFDLQSLSQTSMKLSPLVKMDIKHNHAWKALPLFLTLFGLLLSDVYHITPSASDPCPTETCLTLSQFADNSTNFLNSTNTTLIFLPGNHNLESQILFANVSNISMLTMSSLSSNSVITCGHDASFKFVSVNGVYVGGLKFVGCAGNKVESVEQFILECSSFVGRADIIGTALELVETSANLVKCSFDNNKGDKERQVTCHDNFYKRVQIQAKAGGAISARRSRVKIMQSVFEGNSAEIGGVIFSELNSNITIINSTFVGNHATSTASYISCVDTGGGALYADSGSTVINIINSQFMDNTAVGRGGVVYLYAATNTSINITDSKFTDNAQYSYEDFIRGGGALFMKVTNNTIITITDSEFKGNSAQGDSGAVYLRAATNTTITITNSEIEDNTAQQLGGGVYLSFMTSSTVTIAGCNFMNNHAQHSGGAVYLSDAIHTTVTITASEFMDNTQHPRYSFDDNDDDCGGGALCVRDAINTTITITDCNFMNNSARYGGGASFIQVTGNTTIAITDCNFMNDSAQEDGGSVLLYGATNTAITIIDSEFIDNAQYGHGDFNGGGALAMAVTRNTTITIADCNFTNNTAQGDGGALIWLNGNDTAIIINASHFNDNFADRGGVVHVHGAENVTIFISYSNFNKNYANNGGVVSCSEINDRATRVTITEIVFEDNNAYQDGGVFELEDTKVEITRSNFIFNRAGGNGGVTQMLRGTLKISDSQFQFNTAGNVGGVIRSGSGDLNISESNFISNSVDKGGNGGVLHAQQGTLTIAQTSFTNNTATFGGVMWAKQATVRCHNATFFNDSADTDGGVFYTNQTDVMITKTYFIYNRAVNNGGIMCTNGGTTNIIDSCFNRNTAGNTGGVLRLDSGDINISKSNFTSNSVDKGGNGGVLCAHQGTLIIAQTSFTSNKANFGGVMWVQQTTVKCQYVTLFDNSADTDGGVLYAERTSTIISGATVSHNTAANNGGVMYIHSGSNIITENKSKFFNNTANEGGVVYLRNASLTDLGCMYINNMAKSNGGAITLNEGEIKVIEGNFVNNTAGNNGGVLYTPIYWYKHNVTLERSVFHNNKAVSGGVIAMSANDFLTLTENIFSYNNANRGGAIHLLIENTLNLDHCNFTHNSANVDGGVIYSEYQNSVMINDGNFRFNKADGNGGVFCLLIQTELTIMGSDYGCTFVGNQAQSGGVTYASESEVAVHSQTLQMDNNTARDNGGAVYLSKANLKIFGGNCTFVGNIANSGGTMYASESEVAVNSQTLQINNSTAIDNGGAVCLSGTNLKILSSNNTFMGNQAKFGGAIYASESNILMETSTLTKVKANSAQNSGGGLYITSSELNFKVGVEGSYITGNSANKMGGGLHAANTSIIVEGSVHIANNEATNGGGVSLERYAKLKPSDSAGNDSVPTVNFVSNRASQYGGALYVDDETNPDMCAAGAMQNTKSTTECFLASVFINFSENSADVYGSNLFGGLLDRCTVDTELSRGNEMDKPGVANFQKLSNISNSQLDTISSHPVHVCFCKDNQPACSYQPESIQVAKRKTFPIELIVYDQVNNAVNATVHCSLKSTVGGLGQDQVIQHVNEDCTELQFNLFSPRDTEQLVLSVKGACNDTEATDRSIKINIICTCPIGFQISNNDVSRCDCVCDQVLQPYDKTECNITTESIIRKDNFWITYVNNTNSSGYIIYPHCPFDYCHQPEEQVSINLNLPNGSNAQCASNRMGTLCGTCKPGFSVSLGSSHCLQCPTYWPGLSATIVVVFILSGIGLVALLLVLNLTVAVGTLNAIIFYANILAADKSVLFSTSEVSFASVFISWLNFDFGIDTCFFEGMDMFVKTWLQLAFPVFIFFLVSMIIKLSYYFSFFGRLIGKKDPVATLATLILLSYTKLLQTIIAAFSSAYLSYPDGSTRNVWLPDATVGYFTSKHAVLFVTAVLILLVGLTYTVILFSWQWVHRCPRKRVKWIRNQKLSLFLETYHAPYTAKHRYWTGLLLLIRVSIYLVSAVNLSGDPRVTLLSIIFIVGCLFLYMVVFGIWVYKNWFINAMEMFTYFNIITLSIFKWYTFDNDKNQVVVADLSVGITFIQLLVIMFYHTYKYTMFSRIQNTAVCKRLNNRLKRKRRAHGYQPLPNNDNIHQFHGLLDMIDRPVNTNDYNIPQVRPEPVEPTYSVVEVPKPHPAPPSPHEQIREEAEPESQQQFCEQDDITIAKENQSALTNENNQCLNNCTGMGIAECVDTIVSPGTKLVVKPTSESHANLQDNDKSLDIQQANSNGESVLEIYQSNNIDHVNINLQQDAI